MATGRDARDAGGWRRSVERTVARAIAAAAVATDLAEVEAPATH
jgi:hypothetical protein